MIGPAAQRWADLVAAWAPPPGLASATADVDPDAPPHDGTSTSTAWAREVLPPRGGTVLDVGCGRGRASLPLVPPATELIGVDRREAMLDEFVRAATGSGVARRTVHGEWPDVAPATPVADVVVCHHVLYDVADAASFVLALTDHARLAVVVEIPVRHPMSPRSAAWPHVRGATPPDGPTHADLVAVLREVGLDPEVAVGPRGLPTDPPAPVDEIATLRWPGEARPH